MHLAQPVQTAMRSARGAARGQCGAAAATSQHGSCACKAYRGFTAYLEFPQSRHLRFRAMVNCLCVDGNGLSSRAVLGCSCPVSRAGMLVWGTGRVCALGATPERGRRCSERCGGCAVSRQHRVAGTPRPVLHPCPVHPPHSKARRGLLQPLAPCVLPSPRVPPPTTTSYGPAVFTKTGEKITP